MGDSDPASGERTPGDRADAVAVSFRGATKRYRGGRDPRGRRLTLEVESGEICVLVGPSGCGKTTAMRMVNRMVEITDGDILVGGTSVRDRSPAELRREIGYVIQQIGLFPHRTILENIATVPRLLGWDAERSRKRAEELLGLSASTRSWASASRPSFRAASSSASASLAPSPRTPA